jgi:hypothetical protein
MRPIIKYLLFVFFCYPSLYGQYYFPPAHGTWQQKKPSEYSIDSKKIAQAIDFAKENEYGGSKDLRIAILHGFSKEPYHKILGPTKKRGGPAGMILKNGYQIASWGTVERWT